MTISNAAVALIQEAIPMLQRIAADPKDTNVPLGDTSNNGSTPTLVRAVAILTAAESA